jgi:hypothetical protein
MGGWFGSGPVIDTGSRRWTVAVHEAAHVVVARRLGWRVRSAQVFADGSGYTDDVAPAGGEATTVAVQNAVIALAGPCASARQRWFLPAGCGHDERDARRALRGTGVSYNQARTQARRLVDRHWRDIDKVARRLYHDGHLTGGSR